jgi:hypothetical protein
MNHAFGLLDYWKMLKKRGPRLPLAYFAEAHLFDIINKTDTHRWIPDASDSDGIPNSEHGHIYMCSWTSEIVRSFRLVHAFLGASFTDYNFIDIGCGKGKVVLCWERQLDKLGIKQNVYGVDYNEKLLSIASRNHQIMFHSNGNFLCRDATKIETLNLSNGQVIIYLFNPFNSIMLQRLLGSIQTFKSVLIYNNPEHSGIIENAGYKTISRHDGFHPCCQTIVYSNT